MYYYRRKTSPFKWLIVAIIIIAIGIFGYWFYVNYFSKIEFPRPDEGNENSNTNLSAEDQIVTASLNLADKEVTVSQSGKEEIKAEVNMALNAGDTITTGPKSQAIIKLANGTVLRLNENSAVKLESLIDKNIVIEQLKGRVYHNLTTGGKYQVKYNQAVITALSTKFETIINSQLNYLAVLDMENKVTVEILKANEVVWSVRLEPGEKALVDFMAKKNEMLRVENFDLKALETEVWYKWNFDLDRGLAEKLVDDEPDFAVVTDSLVLAGENKENGVYLSWSVYESDDFSSYQIMRSEKNKDLRYPDDTVIKTSTDSLLNSYLDAKGEKDTAYYYRICVLKLNDKVVCGAVINVKPLEEEKDDQAPAAPYLRGDVSVSGVALSWTTNSEEDFKEYRILKSLTNPNLSWPAIGSLATRNKDSENFLDKEVNITSAGFVYYRICSLDTSGNSACSNVITIENGQIK